MDKARIAPRLIKCLTVIPDNRAADIHISRLAVIVAAGCGAAPEVVARLLLLLLLHYRFGGFNLQLHRDRLFESFPQFRAGIFGAVDHDLVRDPGSTPGTKI